MKISLGSPTMPPRASENSELRSEHNFVYAAQTGLSNATQRANLKKATTTIRDKRLRVTNEKEDWEQLRQAGSDIKRDVGARLDELLLQFEHAVTQRGGHVHWARDGQEACEIITRLVQETGQRDVVKIKSMATMEIGLNSHLEQAGISAQETDLAELIVQLGDDKPSHILVPAIHRNRAEIRDIFLKKMPHTDDSLSTNPTDLAEASRVFLREQFMKAKVAISGANFGVAETGTITIMESEGNGRMCLTLPETLITVMGIEKIVPTFRDLEVFLQLLPRSSTGERQAPYVSTWSGVTKGDGPQNFHIVLVDNGRTAVLADEIGREALKCIRCSACLNVCPVYERAGGHAYGSTYPGPIGAILTPQLTGIHDKHDPSAYLPYASSLCGRCNEVCPVKIPFTDILLELRHQKIEKDKPKIEGSLMGIMQLTWGNAKAWDTVSRMVSLGRILGWRSQKITHLPSFLSGWTDNRDVALPPRATFRQWFETQQAQELLRTETKEA
ncbi:iron-sulfur cluster-binding protein [Corynebacterium sp. sy017]|uniref:LutB/LldF family L-lactate oxidation iron-sulfur protein n=1 Tax=unclassified Corynebacterium TaxID=2624378 RepID=UPI0011860FAF|nr:MULTISPECIES: LutB/LldF family L-lactate oxidation iron-sulfur protein [unclassified Corynebacterium]MBP3088997.1 iron-sulfur cluster-binding protein [Corynebacterium sp. sy017]TSD91319.1 iron-sulfur cluster-binding protein [Corynebacterium sp. SY003]